MAKLPPTKGNLIAVKRSYSLAKNGYELMDKKRNILIREMMSQIDRAKVLQQNIDEVFSEAYEAIARANISMGGSEDVADSMRIDESVQLRYRSVMGVELPTVNYTKTDVSLLPYGFWETTSALDLAYHKFVRVKELTLELAAGLCDEKVPEAGKRLKQHCPSKPGDRHCPYQRGAGGKRPRGVRATKGH